jgi:hypothetical protein
MRGSSGGAVDGWRRCVPPLFAAALVASALGASPTSASADAGTIASATPVVYGQQEFGNTLNGGTGEPSCFGSPPQKSYRSWWALSVTAGDELKVDWETHQTSMNLNLFPVGTTDFTFLTGSPLVSQQVNANFKAEAKYTATQTGVLPFEFHSDTGCGSEPGPYDFVASVLHAVVLSLPVVTQLPPAGTVTVGVHNPDGAPLSDPSLVVTFNTLVSESPTAVGSAPVVNGVATIPFTLPASAIGHSVTVEATSAGGSYLPSSSATESVTVPAPYVPAPYAPPPICIVPSVRRHETLSHIEAVIRHAHCTVGRVRRVHNRRHRRGTVISVSPRSASHLPTGARVSITVSRGR